MYHADRSVACSQAKVPSIAHAFATYFNLGDPEMLSSIRTVSISEKNVVLSVAAASPARRLGVGKARGS